MVRLAKRSEIAKAIFRVRDFKGQPPAVIRRRFQLATAIIKDVTDGKIRLSTAKKLAREAFDRILESPFLVTKGTHGSSHGLGPIQTPGRKTEEAPVWAF